MSVPGVKERILPFTTIYGANASGKTNLLRAFAFFREAILKSHRVSTPTGAIPRKAFALDEVSPRSPSRFDCDFIVSGVRYHYGFSATDNEFEEEWLYAFPKGSRQTLFNRDRSHKKINFGKNLRGKNTTIASLVRPNSLFLSAAAQNGHEQLLPIYNYFENKWHGMVSAKVDLRQLALLIAAHGIDDRLLSFLKHADIGINSARIEDQQVPAEVEKLVERFQHVISEEFSSSENLRLEYYKERKNIALGHQTASGEDWFLNLGSESRGTLRLLNLIFPILQVIDNGGVLFVDEIDSSLHTLLSMKLLEVFGEKKSNPCGAQLVVTTHDTNLLCSGRVRRDQIWFCEKSKIGATHVYPLTDIQTRNTDNLEKGYLEGRFGAVPFLGAVQKMLSGKVA
ncbi:MAG: ATP-binding protein [Xanthobacteraceae bacterium]|nr:ATP-binding protein [Xanthobacteraceae bacterium]